MVRISCPTSVPDYGIVFLEARLRDAIARLNAGLPVRSLGSRVQQVDPALQDQTSSLATVSFTGCLRTASRLSTKSMTTVLSAEPRRIVIDFDDPFSNDFLAVNQVTVHGKPEQPPC